MSELFHADLEADEVRSLFRDIADCASDVHVIPKTGPRDHAPAPGQDALGLEEALERLLSGRLYGVQVRYQFQEHAWWDTLLSGVTRYRLVRVRAPEEQLAEEAC